MDSLLYQSCYFFSWNIFILLCFCVFFLPLFMYIQLTSLKYKLCRRCTYYIMYKSLIKVLSIYPSICGVIATGIMSGF